MLTSGRPLITMSASRTTDGYMLTVQVPEWATGTLRDYTYQFSTLAALRQRMDALQAIWLDAELIALGDSLTPC